MITTQIELDYMQAANQRVAADTLLLKKKVSLSVTGNVIGLPLEAIRLDALYAGDKPVVPISTVDYMRIATGALAADAAMPPSYTMIGRSIYLWPTPTQSTLTAFYSYRPAPIDSGSTFELSGSAERLIERLVSSYVLMDDGQPELAQQELSSYLTDASRLRRLDRRKEGRGQVLRLAGHRQAPG